MPQTSPSEEVAGDNRTYQPIFEFTLEDVQALHRLLLHEFIPYQDEAAQKVATKVMRIVAQHELVAGTTPST